MDGGPDSAAAGPLFRATASSGNASLSTTGTYLEGISLEEIIGTIHGRKATMMHASAELEL